MIATIEFLIALAVVFVCVQVYRRLIKSPRFNSLVDELVEPPPDTDDGLLDRLQHTRRTAAKRADENQQTALQKAEAARRMREQL